MTIERSLVGEAEFGRRRMPGRSSTIEETLRPTGPGPVSRGYDVRELWYRLLAGRWSCLVVVSPERTPNTLHLASSLAELGTQQRRRPVEVVDGLQLDLERANAIAHLVEPPEGVPRSTEPRFVIALDSPIVNPIAFGVLAAGDAVLMLLQKGVSKIPEARKIIEVVGGERMIGAVLAVE
jgi:hypothetical protein